MNKPLKPLYNQNNNTAPQNYFNQRLDIEAKEGLKHLSPEQIKKLADEQKFNIKAKMALFGLLYSFVFLLGLIISILHFSGATVNDTTSAQFSNQQTVNSYTNDLPYEDSTQEEPLTYEDAVVLGIMMTCLFTIPSSVCGAIHFTIMTKQLKKNDEEHALVSLKKRLAAPLKLQIEHENDQLSIPSKNFTITKTFKLFTKIKAVQKVFLDENNKMFAIKNERGVFRPQKYSDLINYEVYENGNSILEGKTGRAIVGGLVGGSAGAIIGSSASREMKGTCTDLQIIIHINDPTCTPIILTYIQRDNLDKDSSAYRKIRESLQQICSQLQFILNQKNLAEAEKVNTLLKESSNIQKSINLQQSAHQAPTKKEELLELKELFDEGLISEEEFNQKRKKILGL